MEKIRIETKFRSDIMETSKLKNIVMLKNLPSNIIEEAIIIFKEPQMIKEKELIERGNKMNISDTQTKSKQYILKEAEMLVSNYITKIEKNKKFEQEEKNTKIKYKKLKKYTIILAVMLFISIVINFI